ncbi:MAG: hypothetical protein EU529_10785 [Promethearchaeota archaeon]|nr:MAG: hypothetical protein EU529_10785 [Candidatus Lokiarchaeota archaeon]
MVFREKNYRIKFFILFLSIIILGVFLTEITSSQDNNDINKQKKNPSLYVLEEGDVPIDKYIINNDSPPYSASSSNSDLINNTLDNKMNEYSSKGYFPQIYKSSLQATYYAVYLLHAINRLNTVNQTEITDFIMSHYNSSTYTFIDAYAERYLSIDFSTRYEYYPFTTLLEVNCYAILTLEMLGQLGLIDKQESIDFIWSCYNPITGGFIGRPYATSPDNEYRISTMDNTYFALTTLDLLMDTWVGYETQISNIIDYINSLQESGGWQFGGFWNDLDKGANSFDSLEAFASEPNIFSSYYCVKSLELFGMEDTIRVNDFLDYLGALYNEGGDFFQYCTYPAYTVQLSVPASAVGLELSDIYGYAGINRSAVLDYLFDNRNSMGSWEQCNIPGYHELIDSYQVIRSLVHTGEISQLTSGNKNEIANSMTNYMSGEGFSALSEDYMSLSLLYSIVNSFDLYGRVGDLDIQMIYDFIDDATEKYPNPEFTSVSMHETNPLMVSPFPKHGQFRAYPIEYSFPNRYSSLMTLYKALDILERTSKLDDFDGEYDLEDVISEVVNSQYLNNAESNFGGFMADSYWNDPWWDTHSVPEEWKDNDVRFKYSYWAIKILKLISDYKGLGDYESLGVDTAALYSYVSNNIIETPTEIYSKFEYSNKIEDSLEATYYMIYILNETDMFSLNTQKIKNFIENNLDYSNIKNIYYSWKIDGLLDLDIEFNFDLIYDLINDIHDNEYKEFYLTTERKDLNQDILLWVCELYLYELSDSSLIINIEHLENCKFLSTENYLKFNISSSYSGTYFIWINNQLANSTNFNYGETTHIYSLDNYTAQLGDYILKINATSKDDNYCETSAIFAVFSDSVTIVNILELNNYKFMSEGNNISFQIFSQYPDQYNFTIDGNKISSGHYYDGEIFNFSIDGYKVGVHNVSIIATALDGKDGIIEAYLSVYSDSETIIKINHINNFLYNSTGNILNFSIFSDYPDSYELKIDNILVDSGKYLNGESIIYSLDGYKVGIHTVLIWANSSDEKETSSMVQFQVFGKSFIYIDIISLPNYEFRTTEHTALIKINASFPESYKIFIDNFLVYQGCYEFGGDIITSSIDGYDVGEHHILIWANDSIGKVSTCGSSFTVYSLSITQVEIIELNDYEFMSLGHFVSFNISSRYPDYFKLFIDTELKLEDDYISGELINYCIDGYGIGPHNITIWAIGEDYKVGTASAEFIVFSNSITLININEIPNYQFMTTGNLLNFSISSDYSGFFNVSIDDVIVDQGPYIPDEDIVFSIDGYTIGIHNIRIWAQGMDKKEAFYETLFEVYTNSTTIINLEPFEGFEFMTIGNY